jgi:hypothetical protein
MARKTAKAVKPTKAARAVKAAKAKAARTERWTVRGVAGRLQRAAAEAAREDGVTLGAWVSRLVEQAVIGREPSAAAMAAEWRQRLEARVARLEAAAGLDAADAAVAEPGEG